MIEKRIATIEALLAKAETTTPEEAEALTAKAEALIIKYGIEQASIDAARKAKGGKPEEIVKKSLPFGGRFADTLVTGGWRVAKAMSGGTVDGYRIPNTVRYENGKRIKGTTLVLIGFESDVEQAERLIESLVLQSVVARDAWWKTERDATYWCSEWEKFVERRSFVAGFFDGAADRLKQEREVAERDATDSEPGTAIALRDRKSAVKDELSKMGLRKGRGQSSYGANGTSAGHRAGRSANVGTTGVGGTRRAIS